MPCPVGGIALHRDADGITAYFLTQPSTLCPPRVEGPGGAFYPALLGPGPAPAPERARLTLGLFGSPWCHARSTPSAGRCISQLASLRSQSGGAPSGRSPSASAQLSRDSILAACARPIGPPAGGGSRTFRLTHDQPATVIPNPTLKASPAEWQLIGRVAGAMVKASDREARYDRKSHAPSHRPHPRQR